MIKKVMFLCAVATFMMITSCKKENALVETNVNGVKVLVPADSVSNTKPEIIINLPKKEEKPPKITKFPIMTFDQEAHDFGTIQQGETVVYNFNFTNTGESDLIITAAHGSCGCTVPEYPKEPIKPGEKGQIKVSFNSTGKTGVQKKSVTIGTNTIIKIERLSITATITGAKKGSGITSK